jgi:sulfonate transport system permease protein
MSLCKLEVVKEDAKLVSGWFSPRNLLRALIPSTVIVLWQVLSSTGVINPQLFPSPLQVIAGFVHLVKTGALADAIPASLGRAGIGLTNGLIIGVTAGTIAGLFRLGDELFDSTFQIIRAIPFIALLPLMIIWFGIEEEPKIILISIACIFPAYVNTYAGVRHVDSKLIEAGKVFGMNKVQLILKVILPMARPQMLVGLRYAMTTSLLALIVAEQINAQRGIGAIILNANSALRIDLMISGILVYATIGIMIDILMRVIEQKSMPWK